MSKFKIMKIFCNHIPIILMTEVVHRKEGEDSCDAIYIACRCSKCNKFFADRIEKNPMKYLVDYKDARVEAICGSFEDDGKVMVETIKFRDKSKKDKIIKTTLPIRK